MLVVKIRVCAIKQFGKRDNVYQRPFGTTQLFENNSSKNIIKNVFNFNLITTQLGCRLRRARMLKRMASQPLRINTPN
jgi:hypothetical protein